MERRFYWIAAQEVSDILPPTDQALNEPDGLLAAGGDLSIESLLHAYKRGVFPWYSKGQPILWWSPNPRCVLRPEDLTVSRSLRKSVRNRGYHVTLDVAFPRVIDACGRLRENKEGTWILPEVKAAYTRLHRLGLAHSAETWMGDQLVGGLYGVALGKMFFGESMFSRAADASKVAFVYLVEQLKQWDYGLIDCQMRTDHMQRLGAVTLPRHDFEARLTSLVSQHYTLKPWRLEMTKEDILTAIGAGKRS